MVKFKRLIVYIVIFGVVLLVFSQMAVSCKTNDRQRMYTKELIDDLLHNHRGEIVEELAFRPNVKVSKYARFAIDSCNYPPAYAHLPDGRSHAKDVCAKMIYYAYTDNYDDTSFGKKYMPIKKDIAEFLGQTYSRWGEEYRIPAWRRSLIDSLKFRISSSYDTVAYLQLRYNTGEIEAYAKLLVDSLNYAPALYDIYDLYVQRFGTNHPFDLDTFRIAYPYLERAAEQGFLPAICQKSVMMLTGVYVPQDTILGKELFFKCLDAPCPVPFWRYVEEVK